MMAGNFAGFAAVAEFDANGILQLNSLGGLVATDSSSQAWANNNWGEVVGASSGNTGRQAFYWNSVTGMIALGTLGGNQSEAFDINDRGQVVGRALPRRGDYSAFVWQNGKMSDLNLLSGATSNQILQSANGINNSGHIVGEMRISKPVLNYQAFLLTPKP